MIVVKNLTPFARKVLEALEPDEQARNEILKEPVLEPVSQAECMKQFASHMEAARKEAKKVLVAGDYDCDGVMATSILVDALRKYGLQCAYYIPNRMKEGYGLNENTVQMAHDKGYSLIVTVDNGVKAHKAIAKARELGMEVIVTDHHTLEDEVKADLLVHPDLLEKPFQVLCGAGVAYECARVLGVDEPKHLMWAGMATIADCMPVFGESRALISLGLEELNRTQEPHLALLCKENTYNEDNAGFQIIPRINSIGRMSNLGNVNTLVKYMLSNDQAQMAFFARQLDEINEKRKLQTRQTTFKAESLIRPLDGVLLAYDPDFHEGLVGLAAGQLCTKYYKPAIVCTLNGDVIKGSMRSPADFHCLNFLKKFDGFKALGGHAQAAGFSVPKENWEDFQAFVRKEKYTPNPDGDQILWIDPDEITVDNIQSLDALRPFGTGFPSPHFGIDQPKIRSSFDLSEGKHRKFWLDNNVAVLHFNQSSSDMAASANDIVSFTGTLSVNWYQGRPQPNFLADTIEYK